MLQDAQPSPPTMSLLLMPSPLLRCAMMAADQSLASPPRPGGCVAAGYVWVWAAAAVVAPTVCWSCATLLLRQDRLL